MHLSGDPRYGQIDATPSWLHYLIYFVNCGTVGYSSLTYNIQENGDNQGEIIFEQGYMEITYEILPNSSS